MEKFQSALHENGILCFGSVALLESLCLLFRHCVRLAIFDLFRAARGGLYDLCWAVCNKELESADAAKFLSSEKVYRSISLLILIWTG